MKRLKADKAQRERKQRLIQEFELERLNKMKSEQQTLEH
jgi:hypothetical protein